MHEQTQARASGASSLAPGPMGFEAQYEATIQPRKLDIDAVEAGVKERIGLLDEGEQRELGERLAQHFGWQAAGMFTDVRRTPKTPEVNAEWLSRQYDLAVRALSDLGFSRSIPTFEQIKDAITEQDAVLLNARRAGGAKDELVIVPRLQTVGLIGTKRKPGLIPRFDRKQKPKDATRFEGSIWDVFDDKDPLHDRARGREVPTVAILLGGKSVDDEAIDGRGLVARNRSVSEQRETMEMYQEAHRAIHKNNRLVVASIGHIVMANAARRINGEPMLDQHTTTRLIHYPGSVADGVPTVRSDGRQLVLGRSPLYGIWNAHGIRRALRLKISAEIA